MNYYYIGKFPNTTKEDLIESSTTIADTWFSADILFNGSKILIILQSSKKCNQQNRSVPPESVDIAQVSITRMRSIINTAPGMYWGTRYARRRSTNRSKQRHLRS